MNNCKHFWKLDLTTLEDEKPTWICMNCDAKKKDGILILDFDKFINNGNQTNIT